MAGYVHLAPVGGALAEAAYLEYHIGDYALMDKMSSFIGNTRIVTVQLDSSELGAFFWGLDNYPPRKPMQNFESKVGVPSYVGRYLIKFVFGGVIDRELIGVTNDSTGRPVYLHDKDGTVYNFTTIISIKELNNEQEA